MSYANKLNQLSILLKNGKISKAFSELSLLSSQASFDPNYLTVLAEALTHSGQSEALLKVLLKRAEITKDVVHFIAAAEQMYKHGKLNDALDICFLVEANVLHSVHKETIAELLIKIYIELNDFDGLAEVLNCYSDVLEFSDFAVWSKGVLLLSQDQTDLALEQFRKAVLLNSNNEKSWVSLGLIHLERADSNLALSNFERALDINPKNEIALKSAAKIVDPYSPKSMKMLELIQNYLTDYPADLEMRRSRIQILQAQNKNQEAVLEYKHLQFMTQVG